MAVGSSRVFHRRERRPALAAAVLWCALLAPGAAHAQPQDPGEYDRLVLRALAAYDAGRWDEARGLFERAHSIDPTARTLRTIGMSAFNQGDLVGALRTLEKALVDERRPLTPEQRTHVQGLIDQADRGVGRYRIHLEPADSTLLVDGKAPELLIDELVLTPGLHELVLSAPGHTTLRRSLPVRGQDRAPLELVLEPASPALASKPAARGAAGPDLGVAPAAATPATASDDPGDSVGGWVALSAGTVALAVSGVTLALALDDKATLERRCPSRTCPTEVEDTRSRYQTLRILSPVALGVGVIGVTIGALVLLGAGSDQAPGQATLQPILAPGYVGVGGRL